MSDQSQAVRCAWVGNDQLYRDYHDREWGVPAGINGKQRRYGDHCRRHTR